MTKSDNPLDDLEKEAEPTRGNRELTLWKTWDANGRKPEHLEPLLQSFQPLVVQKTRELKPPTIPESAFQAELKKHMIGAFETFNPARAGLSTHVNHRIRKVQRYVSQYQNVGYIPEGQSKYIGKIRKAENQLTQDFGVPPTQDQIADHLGMPLRTVNRIMTSTRRDIPGSMLETDPNPAHIARDQEVLSLLHYELDPAEKEVFDIIFGKNGQTKMDSTSAIAKKIGKSDSQVARLKSSIIKKYESFK